jgi:hypothetical protein
MNVEIGTEAAQFLSWEYMNELFSLQCRQYGLWIWAAWIRINLSCWIRIGIQKGKNNPQK